MPTQRLLEKHVQKACEDLLELDGWRLFRLEQNWSERKRKIVGEPGAPDCMAVRYLAGHKDYGQGRGFRPCDCQVLLIEWTRPGGRPWADQLSWRETERLRGAESVIAGLDFRADVEGFLEWYTASGLRHRV